MSKLFRPSHRALQERYDTVRLADRIESHLFREHVTADDKAFIERLDMFFLATADRDGFPNCSYKGGDPGFVRVLDEHTLLFPNFDGNGMYLSLGNAQENPPVGLLFIDFENQKRLRVNGTASFAAADSVSPPYTEAQCLVMIAVRQVFPNCPALHPQDAACRNLEVRAAGGSADAGARLEADGMGSRRVAGRRSGARP
jgi:uncharacterized protein